MNATSDSSNDPFNGTGQRTGRQTIIDMQNVSDQTEHVNGTATTSNEGLQGEEQANGAQEGGNQSWHFNFEINQDMLSDPSSVNRENLTALLNSVRQLLRHLDVLYFVPEAHFLNMLMLLFILSLSVILVKLFSLSGLIFLAGLRFFHYMDACRFDLKNESLFMNTLMRVGIRNLIIYLVYEQETYINVLSFNVVESDSFTYVLFIVSMANLMVLDVVLVAKILFAYVPGIQLRKKQEIFKLSDYFITIYLALLPVLQWYAYIGNIWVALPYLALKFTLFAYLVYHAFMLLKQFIRSVKLGNVPSKAELCDQICSICHSEPEKPIKTNCGHIFDEACLKEWLEVKNECPLCRATVLEKHKHYPSFYLFPPYVL
ncbi:RING/U-box domain-containing protein [Aphelenchoides bicaudatus]|nr:RING/U-box domain-containing protein [Aphelenchoides bicaudatus]